VAFESDGVCVCVELGTCAEDWPRASGAPVTLSMANNVALRAFFICEQCTLIIIHARGVVKAFPSRWFRVSGSVPFYKTRARNIRLCINIRTGNHRRFGSGPVRMTILRSIRSSSLALHLLAAIPIAALPLAALGQQPTGAGARSQLAPPSESSPAPVDTVTPSPKTTLAAFAWLAGRWQGVWGPRVAQQVWAAPKAGVMLGAFQLAENDKTLVLEVFTVMDEQDGIKFHLRHFTPSLTQWEKTGPIVLNLVSADPKTMIFENPVAGQPKRTVLTRIDADTYVARSEILPENGELQVTEITYHRQKETPPARH
jgi:hypothetical protein